MTSRQGAPQLAAGDKQTRDFNDRPDPANDTVAPGAAVENKEHVINARVNKGPVTRTHDLLERVALENFSIRLGVSRVCEISAAFFFGNAFQKNGDCSPKLVNSARIHFA
jgi:hypothetical protein